MAQHDYVIDNQSFPATRTDINNVLLAISSTNSGTSAPSTTYANQLWYDTTNNKLYIRNEDNDAWIPLFLLDQSNDVASTLATEIDVEDASGTDTAGTALTIKGGAGTGTGTGGSIIFQTADGAGSTGSSVNAHATRVTITDDGKVGIGTTSPSAPTGFTTGTILDVANAGTAGDATDNASIRISSANRHALLQLKAKNTFTSFIYFGDEDDDDVGKIQYDHTSNFMAFTTGAAERVRIDSSGRFLFGKSTTSGDTAGVEMQPVTSTNSSLWVTKNSTGSGVIYTNRTASAGDGSMIIFAQNGNVEGSISVSGTTVSYNGGHLSRWSQLTDGTKDTSIVKGTVMTNLDQMAVWAHDAVAATYYVDGDELPNTAPATYYTEDDTLPDGVSVGDEKTAAVFAQVGDEKTPAKDAYTEDNEQLNCMAVSSVEGDANVAGVFVNWDNDDDGFNDMNVAMTGDMVIRIAQGTTVARGDLLMSAGDGTAKPQGDDIVRSKTIAKVTSTQVSHTYDDGTYLVPCVLMAC